MREILFKAKRKDNGEWVEGNFVFDPDLELALINGYQYYTSENGLEREPFEYEVDAETVCQYIGRNDMSNNKIWENDVLEITMYNWLNDDVLAKDRAKVEFRNGKFGVIWGWHKEFSTLDEFVHTTFEVVGNAHDGTEFLGVRE